MPEFAYTARDRAGKVIEGTIYADNSALALGRVKEMGYEVEKVRVIMPVLHKASYGQLFAENFIYPVVSGVPLKELAQFYRQFSTLINAGIPLYQSLMTLEGQTRNPRLKGILRDCQAQVQNGGKLSEVFQNYNWVFSELQIEMIRAAEHGGMLDQMLLKVADYLEQEIALRRLISRLTLYPKIVVASALFLLGARFFTDGMPAVSKLVIGMMGKGGYSGTDYLMDTFGFLAVVAIVLFGIVAFCKVVLFQSDSAREGYERFKMSIPGLGVVVKQFALAKFGRAFGAMYAAGLPLNAAVRVGGNASGSKVISRAINRIIYATERGSTISQAFRETGVFPNIIVDMLHTGEQTGNVDAMMTKAAEYLEGEAESKAHLYSHIFATTVYLLVAILVGFAVIRFYMGMAGNYGSQMGNGSGE